MEGVLFHKMKESEMREWMAINRDKVNHFDGAGDLLLCHAASNASTSFVAELVDRYGADVRKHCGDTFRRRTALHEATSPETTSVLLERGADPTAIDEFNMTPLMYHTRRGCLGCAERLLQETGALTTVSMQAGTFDATALHWTIFMRGNRLDTTTAQITKLLLVAGADPYIKDWYGHTPLEALRNSHPNDHAVTKRLLEEAMADDGRTFLLHKA